MRIEHYDFGRIVIEGQSYGEDVILLPEGVIPRWWRKHGHSLSPCDLADVVRARGQVDTLIVGTGAFGRMTVPPETRDYLQQQGIQLVIKRTGSAVEEYNRRWEESQSVSAALHLTC